MVFGAFYWLFVVPLIVFKKLPIKNLLSVSSAFIFSLVSFLGLTTAFDIGVVFLFSVLCVAWIIDSSGYFFGKKFGKKKLNPSISPNKTWAGVFGGAFMIFLCSIAFVSIENTWQFSIYQNFGIASLIVSNIILLIISIYADLFESLLKRNAGVKDSGSILPGHGGFFDRFDACLAISPLLVLVSLLNQI
jgi:phosphatidate cytidylyltransferase